MRQLLQAMIRHGGSLGTFEGRAAYRAFAAANIGRALTDTHLARSTISTPNDDKVVVRFTNSGTNNGPFLGPEA